MIPCKEVVRLLGSYQEFSWSKRTMLRIHLLICKFCSRYAMHLKMMKLAFKKLFTKITLVEPHEIDSLEQEILKKLKIKN